jgi:hypothetical protein
VKATILKCTCLAAALGAAALTAGCGEVSRTGRSPVQLVIDSMAAASGAEDSEFAAFLLSDVETLIEDDDGNLIPTIFNDPGQATIRLTLKDPGVPGIPASPTTLNEVTLTRYRVVYRRADGRNAPGVDVPFPIDGALTATVPAEGSVTFGYNLVRHNAKMEAPLVTLINQPQMISTLAEVTFFGRDQAGNDVSVTGHIQVEFGNFGDPQ